MIRVNNSLIIISIGVFKFLFYTEKINLYIYAKTL